MIIFSVLRMGTWARLHPDIREATLEDKLIRLRARIKQENPARKEVRTLEEKLVLLQNLKQSILKELNQDVWIFIIPSVNVNANFVLNPFFFSHIPSKELKNWNRNWQR